MEFSRFDTSMEKTLCCCHDITNFTVNIVLFSGFFKTLFIMMISLVIFVIIRISEMVRQTLQEENL